MIECRVTRKPSAVSLVKKFSVKMIPFFTSDSHESRKEIPSFIVCKIISRFLIRDTSWFQMKQALSHSREILLISIHSILTSISGLPGLIPSPAYLLFRQSNKLFIFRENLAVGSLSSSSSISRSGYLSSPRATDLLKICKESTFKIFSDRHNEFKIMIMKISSLLVSSTKPSFVQMCSDTREPQSI